MPVVQGTIDRGKGKYAIAYAFQPGDNGVRFSYQIPYPSNHADVRLTSDYSVGRVMLVAPPTVQVNSPGFMPAGTEQGFNLYTRDAVPRGLAVRRLRLRHRSSAAGLRRTRARAKARAATIKTHGE